MCVINNTGVFEHFYHLGRHRRLFCKKIAKKPGNIPTATIQYGRKKITRKILEKGYIVL